jgi:hypothetical protein
MNILISKIDTIACLELLLSLHEKLQLRTGEEQQQYSELLRSGQLFTPATLSGLPDLGHLLRAENVIKEKTLEWMVKYTVDAATAVHVAAMTKTLSMYIYDKIKVYFKEQKAMNNQENSNVQGIINKRRMPKTKILYEESLRAFLKHTRYHVLYNMLLEAYQFHYLEKPKIPIQKIKELDSPISGRAQPICVATMSHGPVTIFNDPSSPDEYYLVPEKVKKEQSKRKTTNQKAVPNKKKVKSGKKTHDTEDDEELQLRKLRASRARKEGARKAKIDELQQKNEKGIDDATQEPNIAGKDEIDELRKKKKRQTWKAVSMNRTICLLVKREQTIQHKNPI